MRFSPEMPVAEEKTAVKQNTTHEQKKIYILAMDIANYQFIGQIAGEEWSMALIVNRIIENAREQGADFVEELLKTR